MNSFQTYKNQMIPLPVDNLTEVTGKSFLEKQELSVCFE